MHRGPRGQYTPAQIVFRALCEDLLSRGIKPTHKTIFDVQPRYRFRFVYVSKHWNGDPKTYVLGTAYQGIRIDCLRDAGYRVGSNHRWHLPAAA